MEILAYPFNPSIFSPNTTILLDASFLLSLVYDDDPRHGHSIEVLRLMLNNKCRLFITNIISAEVLNQIMYRVFINDINYKIDKKKPVNSIDNVKEIIHCFGKYDKKIIREKKTDKLREIPYKKYFDSISKNKNKRTLLEIYYKTAVLIHNQLENTVKYTYLDINKLCMLKTKELMVKNLLSINDATHLSACICHNVQYLITLDIDFVYADCTEAKILKI